MISKEQTKYSNFEQFLQQKYLKQNNFLAFMSLQLFGNQQD